MQWCTLHPNLWKNLSTQDKMWDYRSVILYQIVDVGLLLYFMLISSSHRYCAYMKKVKQCKRRPATLFKKKERNSMSVNKIKCAKGCSKGKVCPRGMLTIWDWLRIEGRESPDASQTQSQNKRNPHLWDGLSFIGRPSASTYCAKQ